MGDGKGSGMTTDSFVHSEKLKCELKCVVDLIKTNEVILIAKNRFALLLFQTYHGNDISLNSTFRHLQVSVCFAQTTAVPALGSSGSKVFRRSSFEILLDIVPDAVDSSSNATSSNATSSSSNSSISLS